MKNTCLIAVFLVFGLPAIAKNDSAKDDKKFRHELAISIYALRIPAGDWNNLTTGFLSPEYNIRYKDKYGLKIRLFGWWKGEPLEWGKADDIELNDGQLYRRAYVFWDISSFYTFKLKRHRLNAGLGFTNRKGYEDFAPTDFDWGRRLLVNDQGVIGELGYTYDIGGYFIAGADFAYRAYNRGDPVITAGIKLGVMLRH